MPAYTDIQKAHETANQVRRIQKELKEAQADVLKYNNRERLFAMPVTNVSTSISFPLLLPPPIPSLPLYPPYKNRERLFGMPVTNVSTSSILPYATPSPYTLSPTLLFLQQQGEALWRAHQ